jgi:hypothetical protein
MKKCLLFLSVTIFLSSTSLITNAQISGTVFRDYNGDGIQNNTVATGTNAANIETGIPGVVINAFNAADVLIAAQTTNANGAYSFAVGSGANQIPNGTAVRIEYALPQNCVANSAFDFSGMGASAYGSNVQFKTQAATAVTTNFAINYPAQYRGSANNPKVVIPRMSNGNPVAVPAGSAATQIAMYSFNYTANGQTTTGNNARTSLATAAQIGTCWGVAYNKFNDRIYTSAFLKRHSGLGPGGPAGSPSAINAPGAIYVADPNTTNSGSFFFSMDALGSAYYTHDHTANAALNIRDNVSRGLNKDIGNISVDAAAFDQVGKVGIGDLELSDDGRYLWLTNLYNRKLYRIDFTNAASPVAPTAATAAALVTSWNLPAISCTNGILRPFGLKYYKGKIFVGVVCTGENDANANSSVNVNTNYNGTTVTGGSFNLGNAYILDFDPAGAGTWNTTFTFALNYAKGNAADENFDITRWYNWAGNFDVIKVSPGNASGALIHPQPMLSNIEFDVDGTLMIGFMDRLGHQSSISMPDLSGSGSFYGEVGGDLLRAYNNGCTYQLESNAKEGTGSPKPATAGANTGQGPGSGTFAAGGTNYGEFYWDERYFWPSGPYWAHGETSLGNLAFLPGSNEIMEGVMDPFDIYSNGSNRFSNITGAGSGRYEIISPLEPGTFAKASSLGDIELIGVNAPIEIGNRVWNDADGDGIQDAGEGGLGGVEMELLNNIGSVIASVTTAADGTYYFSSAVDVNTTGIVYNVNILPNTNYVVRVKGTVDAYARILGNAGLGVSHYLTFANVNGNGQPDLSDNDAQRIGGVGGTYQVSVTTGGYGQNNHNVDIGFANFNTLPLKIESFTASPSGNNVMLKWVVSDEQNLLKYDVEFSTNGINYNSIGSLPALNSNNYSLVHTTPVAALNYYRLKITDRDGKLNYSKICVVNFNKAGSITVYPSPVKANMYITVPSTMINKPADISVIALDGKILVQQKIKAMSQTETINLSNLSNGKYFVRIVTEKEIINKPIEVIK